eukprot:363366-Chlamydomonas_euryale.AAC.1
MGVKKAVPGAIFQVLPLKVTTQEIYQSITITPVFCKPGAHLHRAPKNALTKAGHDKGPNLGVPLKVFPITSPSRFRRLPYSRFGREVNESRHRGGRPISGLSASPGLARLRAERGSGRAGRSHVQCCTVSHHELTAVYCTTITQAWPRLMCVLDAST